MFPNSPATAAGLRAHTDYILSSDRFYFQESDDFLLFVADNMGKPTGFLVYNSETDDIRTVCILVFYNFFGIG